MTMPSRCILIAAGLLALLTGAAGAHDYKVGTLTIEHPWTRATPKGAAVAGGYLKITNSGTAPDRLIGGTLPGSARFEIHEMRMANDVMQMRPLPGGLEIKPGETVELKPGSYHLLFMELTDGLQQGRAVKGTLVFERAGPVEVEYSVEAIGGAPAAVPAHRGH